MQRKIRQILVTIALTLLSVSAAVSAAYSFDWQRAVSLYQQGKYRDALAEFQAVVKEYPDFSDAYKFIGFCYVNLNEYEHAIEALKKTLELKQKEQKTDPETRGVLGQSYYFLKSYSEAVPHLSAAAEQQVKDLNQPSLTPQQKAGLQAAAARNYYYLGASQFVLNKDDETIDALKKAIELYPKDSRSPDFLGALELLSQTYTRKATAAQDSQAFAEAVKVGEQLQSLRDDARTALVLGNAYLGIRDFEKAATALKKAADANPDNGPIWFNYGLALSRSKQWALAEVALEKAAQLVPNNVGLLNELGFVYESNQKYTEALNAYQRAYEASGRTNASILESINRVKPFAKN